MTTESPMEVALRRTKSGLLIDAEGLTPCTYPGCDKRFKPQGLRIHLQSHEFHGGMVPDRPWRNKTRSSSTAQTQRNKLNDYLKALAAGALPLTRNRPTPEMLTEKIIAAQESGEFLKAAKLIAKRRSLEDENSEEALELYFISHAAAYSKQHGIDYESWREMGVPAHVLKKAGI